MPLLKALRLPHIALLLVSQVLSAIGDYFYSIAVIWIAVKTSGSAAGLVAAAEGAAAFCFGLPGGIYADRWNRRITMIVVDLTRAVMVLTLPILALNGLLQFWHLVAVSFIIGAVGSLFDPALQASLSALSENDQGALQATNALMDITRRLARALGPTLVGLLVVFLPLEHLFTLDAVSFGVSALALLALGSRFAWKPVRAERQIRGVRGLLAEAGESLGGVMKSPGLRAALISSSLSSFTWSVTFIIGVPLLVARSLGNAIGLYGLIIGAYGVGNVLSNLIVGSLQIKRRVFTIYLGRLIIGLGFLFLAFASNVPMALLASFLASFGGPMGDIPEKMMIQELPAYQIGKVFGMFSTFEYVLYSLGLLVAVPLFALVNVRLGMAAGALLLLLVSLAGLAYTEIRAYVERSLQAKRST
ncbi:MAG TPA: MFS transporter [Ktedonobacteraceae bacterium]|nr:MFS transporter [Ktedonobacteraceae bacterium]